VKRGSDFLELAPMTPPRDPSKPAPDISLNDWELLWQQGITEEIRRINPKDHTLALRLACTYLARLQRFLGELQERTPDAATKRSLDIIFGLITELIYGLGDVDYEALRT
jgi:hypothetical protein